ncbi:glycosyltransferase family 4 protein, partial [Patescibacteria group bacterium]|nr:glycosyltransferase family 4 protein [Patescibacteria group bacterium]
MHIAIFTGDSGIAYGKKNIFYEMLKEFSTHFERVSVICPSNEVGEEIIIHENVHLYPSGHSKFLHLDFFKHKSFIIKKANEIHKNNPIDLITTQIIPPLFAHIESSIYLAKTQNIPFVGELMHVPCYPIYSNFTEWLEKISLKRFLKKNENKISHLRIINKSDTLNYLKSINFPEEKLLYIPAFYLDFETFKPLSPKASKKNKQFVFAGRLEKNKGLNLLIDAFEIAIKNDNEIKLKIIGEGSHKAQTAKLINEKNLNQNIEMLGWLPTQKDVAKIYSESAALIMTSFNEGGPRVTLEAMACKTLCITTKVGIMNQVVKDNENAIFIKWEAADIAEKINRTAKNPDEAKKIAERGFEDVQQFEYHKAIKNFTDK